jgi:hypothetical protein
VAGMGEQAYATSISEPMNDKNAKYFKRSIIEATSFWVIAGKKLVKSGKNR